MTDRLVHLVRHGQAFNTHRGEGEPYPANPPLTPTGAGQAERLARRFAEISFDRLFSSPMRRSIETAGYLAAAGGKPIEILPGSHEFRKQPGYWAWGGRILRERYPDLRVPTSFADTDWYYGEESVEEASRRADRLLATFAHDGAAESPHIVVVTHGAFTRVVLARALGLDPRHFDRRVILDNTSITTLRFSASGVTVLSINDTAHLVGSDLDPLGGISRGGRT